MEYQDIKRLGELSIAIGILLLVSLLFPSLVDISLIVIMFTITFVFLNVDNIVIKAFGAIVGLILLLFILEVIGMFWFSSFSSTLGVGQFVEWMNNLGKKLLINIPLSIITISVLLALGVIFINVRIPSAHKLLIGGIVVTILLFILFSPNINSISNLLKVNKGDICSEIVPSEVYIYKEKYVGKYLFDTLHMNHWKDNYTFSAPTNVFSTPILYNLDYTCHFGSDVGENTNYLYCNGIPAIKHIFKTENGIVVENYWVYYSVNLVLEKTNKTVMKKISDWETRSYLIFNVVDAKCNLIKKT